jgi:hypothetical protein
MIDEYTGFIFITINNKHSLRYHPDKDIWELFQDGHTTPVELAIIKENKLMDT